MKIDAEFSLGMIDQRGFHKLWLLINIIRAVNKEEWDGWRLWKDGRTSGRKLVR